MRLLCRIFLIFCMLFISLSAQACSISLFEENKTIIGTVISTDKQKSEDIINSKHNESVLQLSQKNEGFSIGIRKTGSNFDINPNQLMNIIPSQFSCLLSYIYTLAYLENVSKIIFSLLSNEILPNAP